MTTLHGCSTHRKQALMSPDDKYLDWLDGKDEGTLVRVPPGHAVFVFPVKDGDA
jgi:hypothetical protein